MNRLHLSSMTVLRVVFALCVAAGAFLLGNLGCSSGDICYRQTDCPLGTSCRSGKCVRVVALGDAGTADDSDAAAAATAGTAGTAGGGGDVATAGTAGTGGSSSTAGTSSIAGAGG